MLPLLILAGVFFLVTMVSNARSDIYGHDFYGVWQAGKAVLAGRSPYPDPDPDQLLLVGNSLISPPLLAFVVVPLTFVPFTLALLLWNLVTASSLALALRLVGLRDWRCYVLAFASFPVASCFVLGQLDGLLALGCALAWRYRDRRVVAALAVASLIALKLLAWPLLIWLVATRRTRTALLAAATSVFLVGASWAAIGFKGFSSYPSLLKADADAFQGGSHSIVSAIMRLGAPETPARSAALVVGALLIGFAVAVARTQDGQRRSFGLALGAGIFMSPLVHPHYLVPLLVPLALGRPCAGLAWLLLVGLWVDPVEPPAATWRLLVSVGSALLVVLLTGKRSPRMTPELAETARPAPDARRVIVAPVSVP